MSNMNGNGVHDDSDQTEEITVEWLDGFKTAYRMAYPDGYSEGFLAGHNSGFDEAAERFRVLLKDYYDSDLKEAFERLIG